MSFLRERSACFRSQTSQNRAQFPRRSGNFRTPRRLRADLPRTRLWIAGRRFGLSGVFEPAREFVGDALPVALASSFLAEHRILRVNNGATILRHTVRMLDELPP